MRIHCTVRHSATRIHCTVRAIKSSARLGRSTYMFEAIVSQAQFAICLREKNVWYRSMFLLRSSGEGNILKCLSINVTVFSQSVSHIRLIIVCIVRLTAACTPLLRLDLFLVTQFDLLD